MKLLKQHARFLIVLVVLLVILFIADGQFSEISQSIDQRHSQARSLYQANYRALFSDSSKFGGEPATLHGRRIQDKTQTATQVAGARAERMEFETAPEFALSALPEDASVDDQFAYFQRLDLDLQRELGFQRYFAIDVRSARAFGFERPAGDRDYSSADVARYLRMLDIARTVAHSADRTGVARLRSLEFRAVNDTLAARGVATRGEPPYLSGEGLVLTLQATEEALYNFLLELQRPMKGELNHRYLAVESFKLEKADLLQPADNLISATLTVVAYRINEESSYPAAETAPQQQQTITQPRRFR
jgi:hypothetical protein